MNAKWTFILILAMSSTQLSCANLSAKSKYNTNLPKPRVVVLTDIAPGDVEPDDMESMVRLLAHADQYEIEGLIVSGGWNSSGRAIPVAWIEILKSVINAYEKDLPNLMKRSDQTGFSPLNKESGQQTIGYWPSADYLRSRTAMGSLKLGFGELGDNNNTAGSDLIIQLADEDDDRPLWITVWGGANTLAQAIWKIKKERTPEQLRAFLNKIHVYTITDQDVPWGERHTNYSFSSHQWMRQEFEKDLQFIWDESAWLSQNGIGARNWKEYQTHIQHHGNLGSIYPRFKYGVEGDTPAFLHVMPNGLNNPTEPKQVGWGGYFGWGVGMDKKTSCWTNHEGDTQAISQKYEAYFYQAAFNNFAARMDWAKDGKGNRNPIVIVNEKKGYDALRLTPQTGKNIKIDASGSFDPDGNQLTFKWWYLPEAGTFPGHIDLMNSNTDRVQIAIPSDAAGKTIHIICEVTDNGTHHLTSYRRIIIEPK